MFTKSFWLASLERAVKTAAQTVLATYFVGVALFDVFSADWKSLVGVALGGAVLSVLTSLGSSAYNKGDGPSLSRETLG